MSARQKATRAHPAYKKRTVGRSIDSFALGGAMAFRSRGTRRTLGTAALAVESHGMRGSSPDTVRARAPAPPPLFFLACGRACGRAIGKSRALALGTTLLGKAHSVRPPLSRVAHTRAQAFRQRARACGGRHPRAQGRGGVPPGTTACGWAADMAVGVRGAVLAERWCRRPTLATEMGCLPALC